MFPDCPRARSTRFVSEFMIRDKRVVVVMPAYNAETTLERTVNEIPSDIVDEIVLVDDKSSDATVQLAQNLGLKHVLQHNNNLGYGANQKTCYDYALKLGADIVVMLHPDYQYTPRLIESMTYLIANRVYPVVLGSRILGGGCLKGGMPLYKYMANRMLTFVQNLLMNAKLSEYHTGYRAYAREVLATIPYHSNSNDFVFDNQFLAQCLGYGFTIGEVSCPTRYFKEASSINFTRSVRYGFGVLGVALSYCFLRRWHKPKNVKSSAGIPKS